MNRLKELRKANRMTQSDVAKIVGIGQSGYSFWESGRSKIDDAGLRKLAALYNVSVDCASFPSAVRFRHSISMVLPLLLILNRASILSIARISSTPSPFMNEA